MISRLPLLWHGFNEFTLLDKEVAFGWCEQLDSLTAIRVPVGMKNSRLLAVFLSYS
jgi:hypothetical protein